MTESERARRAAHTLRAFGEYIFAMAAIYPALWFFLLLFKTLPSRIFSSAQARDSLQDQFDEAARKVGAMWRAEAPRDQLWIGKFKQLVKGYLVGQAVLARQRPLMATEIRKLEDGVIDEQFDFVDQFAVDLIDRIDTERAYTQAQIINRMRLYSGAGRALWYTIYEEDYGPGYVVDYIAVDDKGTCHPCLQAQINNPYLPGQGPMPGAVCLGRGRCRCTREVRLDRAAYKQLTDTPQAA